MLVISYLKAHRSNHHGHSCQVAISQAQSQCENTHDAWAKALAGRQIECWQKEYSSQAQVQYPLAVLQRKLCLYRQCLANHISNVEGCDEQHWVPAAQLL